MDKDDIKFYVNCFLFICGLFFMCAGVAALTNDTNIWTAIKYWTISDEERNASIDYKGVVTGVICTKVRRGCKIRYTAYHHCVSLCYQKEDGNYVSMTDDVYLSEPNQIRCGDAVTISYSKFALENHTRLSPVISYTQYFNRDDNSDDSNDSTCDDMSIFEIMEDMEE